VLLNCGILKETWTDKEVNQNRLRTLGCISYIHIELSHRSKLDPKFRRCPSSLDTELMSTVIGSGIPRTARSLCGNRKSLRHKDVTFNEQKTYKDLQTERTSENDLRVAPRSSPE